MRCAVRATGRFKAGLGMHQGSPPLYFSSLSKKWPENFFVNVNISDLLFIYLFVTIYSNLTAKII